MRRAHQLFATVGLSLAIGGPPLLAFVCRQRGAARIVTIVVGSLGMIALAAAVVAIARFGEGTSWSSLGVRRPTFATVAGGLLLAAVCIWIASPLMFWSLRVAGSSGFSPGLSRLAKMSLGERALAVVVAGVVEELLYRGYAIQRLASLTGRRWLGGAIATGLFSLAHAPTWGIGPALALLIPGAIGTAVYLWRQDLVLNMIAHVITDAVGILLVGST
jgi:membrane protease YdiL (CAAX protease family)